jgi:hypothetical protein
VSVRPHPPMSPQPLAAVFALPGYAALDGAIPQSLAALLGLVILLGVKFLGALPWPSSAGALDRLDSLHQFLEDVGVVDVGAGEHTTASGTPLRSEIRWRFEPGLPLSVGFLAVFSPPFWRARSPSPARLAPSRSRWPPPAALKAAGVGGAIPPGLLPLSCKRRQQVLPEPQPIS